MTETTIQPDLFGDWTPPASPVVLREEERFGTWDARTGLPLDNAYRSMLSGDRLARYEAGYRAEIESQRGLRFKRFW